MVISFKFFLLSNKKDMKSKINTCIYIYKILQHVYKLFRT